MQDARWLHPGYLIIIISTLASAASPSARARDLVVIPLRLRTRDIHRADALALADQRDVDAGMQAEPDDRRVVVERFA